MEIERTFAIVDDSLYSVKFTSESLNEFRRLFNCWNDPEFLSEFFTENEQVLFDNWEGMTVEKAILRTRSQANNFMKKIVAIAESGMSGGENLSSLFTPLYNESPNPKFSMQKKAYGGNNTWLRIYAIKLSDNFYVITGGGIKLKDTMSESGLDNEIIKIETAQRYIATGEDENFDRFELHELIP